MQKRSIGQVKWFNRKKRFGFITLKNGQDLFVHYRAIRGGKPYYLREGETVEFSIEQGAKGMEAKDVILVRKETPPKKRGVTGFLRTLFGGKTRTTHD